MDVKSKGAKMFPSDIEKAYAHEVERRKDEMRDAAKHNFESQFVKRRRLTALSNLDRSLTGFPAARRRID
jgi:hypothetical protein